MNSINTLIPVIKKFNARLILVNDGSKDRTNYILQKLFKRFSKYLIIANHHKNKGYGAALQTGIKKGIQMGFKYAIFMDSDLTNDPEDIKKFVNLIPYDYDCIKASRYTEGGGFSNVPFMRKVISTLGNKIASILFGIGINDCTNGFRMVKLDKLKDITYKENGFPIIVEELYHLKKTKCTFKEIPVILSSRNDSLSHFSYTPKMYYDYSKYAFKAFLY